MFAIQAVGMLGLVVGRTVVHLPRLNRRELARGLMLFGYQSLPLTLAIATLTGATVVLQTGLYVQRFGARSHLGWAAGYAVLWEFGPLFLGLMMAARVGARNAAELASLSVGGQLEGLRGISLDPFRLLVAPRVIATSIAVVCLSPVVFAVAIFWEIIAAWATLGLPPRVFLGTFSTMLSAVDLAGGMTKSLFYGVAISLVSTTAGLRAQGGARAVGQAAATAVVLSCASIFALDFILTSIFVRVIH